MYRIFFVIGWLFLANPSIGVIDVLPDVFGYLCLLIAILHPADLHSSLMEAKIGFLRLSVVAGLKALAMIFVLTGGDPTFKLVLSFCFALVEWYFLFPTLKALFSGLSFVCVPKETGLPENMTDPDTLYRLSCVFLIVRNVFSVLPDVVYLFDYREEIVPGELKGSDFRLLISVFSAVIVLVFAVLWLIRLYGWTKRYFNETDTYRAVEERYDREIRPRTNVLLARRIKAILLTYGVAALFTVHLYADGTTLIPDWISAAILLLGLFLVGHRDRNSMFDLLFLLLYASSTITEECIRNSFLSRFSVDAILTDRAAEEAYNSVIVVSIVTSAILLFITTWYLCRLRSLVFSHVLEYSYVFQKPGTIGEIDRLRSQSAQMINIAVIVTAFRCGMDITYTLVSPNAPFIWFPAFIVSLVWFIFFTRALKVTYVKIYDKIGDYNK